MIDKAPKVSVIMAAYNAEPYIAEAIDSIIEQTYQDWELIVIDDGSIDCTADIVNKYNDKRIRYLANDKNYGQGVTRNRGISVAQGKYIAIMDADDIAFPNRLRHQVDYMDNNADVWIVGATSIAESEDGSSRIVRCSENENELLAILPFSSPFAHSTWMMNRNAMGKECHYRDDYLKSQDYELLCRTWMKGGRIGAINSPLIHYRNRTESISHTDNGKPDQWRVEVLKQILSFMRIEKIHARRLYFYYLKENHSLRAYIEANRLLHHIKRSNENGMWFNTSKLNEYIHEYKMIYLKVLLKSVLGLSI